MSNNLPEKAIQKTVTSLIAKEHLGAVESALALNDLSKLNTKERIAYYNAVCESVGLNPLTQPFAYIMLDGKLALYARKECSEQLRKINLVSTQIVEKNESDDFYEVVARATDKTGRIEEDLASVYLYDKYNKKLTGNNLANAKMKCVTKAKRRVTLAISGLGMVDESELETIRNVTPVADPNVTKVFEDIREAKNIEKEVSSNIEPEDLPSKAYESYKIDLGNRNKLTGTKLTDHSIDSLTEEFGRMMAYYDKAKKDPHPNVIKFGQMLEEMKKDLPPELDQQEELV